jgi:hypothetical protein
VERTGTGGSKGSRKYKGIDGGGDGNKNTAQRQAGALGIASIFAVVFQCGRVVIKNLLCGIRVIKVFFCGSLVNCR